MNEESEFSVLGSHLLIENEEGLGLRGSRCQECMEVFFPPTNKCTHCGGASVQEITLGNEGTLWTWTRQWFKPKSPYLLSHPADEFIPFVVGYIEMKSGVKVEARIDAVRSAEVRIGSPMRLGIISLGQDHNGNAVRSIGFIFSDKD